MLLSFKSRNSSYLVSLLRDTVIEKHKADNKHKETRKANALMVQWHGHLMIRSILCSPLVLHLRCQRVTHEKKEKKKKLWANL